MGKDSSKLTNPVSFRADE
jgi:hypothetical protein